MKTAAILTGAFATMAVAQIVNTNVTLPDNFPTCGTTCIQAMYNGGNPKITSCDAQDLKCLCEKPQFSYGVRDCTYSACGSDAASLAPTIFQVAIEICAREGVDISGPINLPPDGSQDGSSSSSAIGTTTAGGSISVTGTAGGVAGATAVTSYVLSTSVNGDETSVITVSTEVFSGVPTATTEVTGTDANGSTFTSTEVMYSTVASESLNASGSSESSDGSSSTGGSGTSSDSGSETTSAGSGSSTSNNFAPVMTAAPGLIAAAGLAALLL